jgi:hypothetical protein
MAVTLQPLGERDAQVARGTQELVGSGPIQGASPVFWDAHGNDVREAGSVTHYKITSPLLVSASAYAIRRMTTFNFDERSAPVPTCTRCRK